MAVTRKKPSRTISLLYVFLMPGEHGEYDLLSYGRDGMPGGEGQAGDTTSW